MAEVEPPHGLTAGILNPEQFGILDYGPGRRGIGGMSWLPWPGRKRLPLHRRDREPRSLARTDPAGSGKSASVWEPVA
jgi:hypothetical protein